MKKIFGVAIAWILMSTISIGQDVSTQNADVVAKEKKCIPTKACAEKAGMTLDECKKVCNGNKASTTSVASASLVSETEAKKATCCSIKDCIAKTGMTEAECKAKCGTKTASAEKAQKTTKVAAATLVNEIEEIPEVKKTSTKCSKSASSCTKKKQ